MFKKFIAFLIILMLCLPFAFAEDKDRIQITPRGMSQGDLYKLLNDLVSYINWERRGDGVISEFVMTPSQNGVSVSTSAFDYKIDGVSYHKEASGFTMETTAVPRSLYGAYRIAINDQGTFSCAAAASNSTGFATAAEAIADLPGAPNNDYTQTNPGTMADDYPTSDFESTGRGKFIPIGSILILNASNGFTGNTASLTGSTSAWFHYNPISYSVTGLAGDLSFSASVTGTYSSAGTAR